MGRTKIPKGKTLGFRTTIRIEALNTSSGELLVEGFCIEGVNQYKATWDWNEDDRTLTPKEGYTPHQKLKLTNGELEGDWVVQEIDFRRIELTLIEDDEMMISMQTVKDEGQLRCLKNWTSKKINEKGEICTDH